MNTAQQNTYAPFPLFLAAAVFIFASPVFWTGVETPGDSYPNLIAENEDLYLEITPTMQYGFGRLKTGELPLWNDRQLCGTPFFANPVHGLLQPLNLGFLFLDSPQALALQAFVSLTLMGIFFVLFMRALGVLYIPAVLGGIVYVCCGATAAAMSRPAIANGLVWMPLLCWTLRAYVYTPRFAAVCGGSIILSLLWLSGNPATAFIVTAFCGLYAVWLLIFTVPQDSTASNAVQKKSSTISGLLVMTGMAAALVSIQWLPTLFWAWHLDAPLAHLSRFKVAGIMPETPRAFLAQLLQVRSGVVPTLGYAGVTTLLLLPAAFLHKLPRWERAFFALAVPVCWAAAIIKGAGRAEGLWVGLVYPAAFSLAVFAGLGADRLFAPRRNPSSPRLWGPLALVAVVFLILFVVAPAPARGRMLPLALSLGLFAFFRIRWAGALSGIILLLFLFVDLNAASVNHYGHPFFSNSATGSLTQETRNLVQNTTLDGRVLASGSPANGIHGNMGMSDGFRMVNGIGLPLTGAQQQWWNALQVDDTASGKALDVAADAPHALLLNVMATRTVAATKDSQLFTGSAPGLRLRRQGDFENGVIYENENALPRIFWSASWRMAIDMPTAFDMLGDKTFDPRRECVVLLDESTRNHLVRTVPDSPLTSRPETMKTNITTQLDKPERIIVQVENAQPGILILSDTYAPGWHAAVDGQEVPILKTNGLFRGIALGAGKHTVSFEYKPLSVIAGAIISAVTVLILVLALLIHWLSSIINNKKLNRQ